MIYHMTSKGQVRLDLRSRSWPHRNRSCCISFDAHRRDKHNERRTESLSQFNLKLLHKNRWWPQVTSDDLLGLSGDIFQLNHQQGPIISRFCAYWANWVAFRGSWNFSHRLIMGRSEKWPDLRSPIWKFRDIRFDDVHTLLPSCEFQTVPFTDVALAHSQSWEITLWGHFT